MNPDEPRPDIPPFDDQEPETTTGDAADFEALFGEEDGQEDPEGQEEPDAHDVAEEAGAQVEDDLDALGIEVARLTDERDQIREHLIRTLADFQNFRKRKEQESVQVRRQAIESFALKLIPVLDNFHRALLSLEKGASAESIMNGLVGVERQLALALESEGVKRVDAVGKAFDPTLHEALGTVEGGDYPADTVVEELEAGYTLGDRLVRPARVRVAS